MITKNLIKTQEKGTFKFNISFEVFYTNWIRLSETLINAIRVRNSNNRTKTKTREPEREAKIERVP